MFNKEYLLYYQGENIHDMQSKIEHLEFVIQQKDDEIKALRDTVEYYKNRVEFLNIIK